jgi:hypothetical protein
MTDHIRLVRVLRVALLGALALATTVVAPVTAQAFCGCFVPAQPPDAPPLVSAASDLFNSASTVVLMREGTRTVLSMQNHYEGPPADFALVVPVPVVLGEDDVKVLPNDVFDHLEQLSGPRLVQYWERDPCAGHRLSGRPGVRSEADQGAGEGLAPTEDPYETPPPPVVVEAEFVVGEYDVVILSAEESTALEDWLRTHDYRVPEGASEAFRPYIESGSKFFVAKVDVERVAFEDGEAVLSPLRFHYDADSFSLPIRLGLLNAKQSQDLIVLILAPEQRYQVANYPNVTIPTNLEVTEAVADRFGAFYAELFDATVAQNPGAVVTEYAWEADSCGPCLVGGVTPELLDVLGRDVLPAAPPQASFVLTRLHMRYTPDSLGEDLVFRVADPIAGGRERRDADGWLSIEAAPADRNAFQARYVLRHGWEGPIACDNPRRGVWVGPPDGSQAVGLQGAQDLAFAARDAVDLAEVVRQPVPAAGLTAEALAHPLDVLPPAPPEPIELAAGFAQVVEEGLSGGNVTAFGLAPGCAGMIPARPGHRLVVTSPTAVRLAVESTADTTLVVQGPGGPYCNDDSVGFNPGLSLTLEPGQYDVFVGTYSPDTGRQPYTLTVSP